MPRGNRSLGVIELVEDLEDMTRLLELVVYADGIVTPDEQDLLDRHHRQTHDGQALALRTQIGISLVRGLDEPPSRCDDLMSQYWATYGPALPPYGKDVDPLAIAAD